MMLGVIDTLAQDGAGNILAGETVEILVWETGARATIYADENGAATADNPLTTNSNGRVLCYVTPGTYNIRSTRSGAPDQFQTVPSLARHEFESHTEFTTWAASRTSPDGTVITVSSGGASVQFIADSAEAITGIPDGWAPFGAAISPLHFGAGLVPGTSDRTAIQAALDYVSGTYSATVNTFTNYVDLSAGVFTTDGPLYANNIRQPGFTIHFGAGGGLFSTQTSGAILEMLGTNTPEYSGIMRLETVDDPDNCPEYGLLLGRAEYGGSAAPVAPNDVVNCQIEGHYSRAAI